MEKLASIANIVIDVGEACRMRGLVEEDLPDGLRVILTCLHRYVRPTLLMSHCLTSNKKSDLDGIEGAMKLCAETSTIKRVLLRADMLQKVRKYDSKLSNVLQTFHVRPDLSLLRVCHANIVYFYRPSSLSMHALQLRNLSTSGR
jgi:hypothetical protein